MDLLKLQKKVEGDGEHSKPFSASTGSQWRFCRRFGLRNLKICGEKISADNSAANKFINN